MYVDKMARRRSLRCLDESSGPTRRRHPEELTLRRWWQEIWSSRQGWSESTQYPKSYQRAWRSRQDRPTLRNLRAALSAAGTDLQNVVSVSAFLSDINDFDAYNSAYREFFVNDPPPRTTVQATLAKGYKVEISLVAILP